MRILAFYPYVPYPLDRGAYHRGYQLLRALAGEHAVDLLALSESNEGAEYRGVFGEFCDRVEVVPFEHPAWPRLFPRRLLNPLPSTVAHWTLPRVARVLGRMLAAERYDAVHIFDLILAQYFIAHSRELPLVIDRTRVDLQYQLMERRRMHRSLKTRLLSLENLAKLWVYEKKIAARARLEIVCGPDDETFLRRYVRRSLDIAAIPNGVDTEYFHPGAGGDEGRSAQPAILFCGAMDYNPNVDALRWYFAEMHPSLVKLIPDLRLWIVGKDPVDEVKAYGERPNVIVTGAVPDVRPYYRRAWLQIVPLRIGGGTRLKIVESMAMGTPVVSTTIGAQGLGLEHNLDLLLAETAPGFVKETARALQNAGLRQELEANGLDTVCSRLSWPMLGKKLCDLYAARFQARPAGIARAATERV